MQRAIAALLLAAVSTLGPGAGLVASLWSATADAASQQPADLDEQQLLQSICKVPIHKGAKLSYENNTDVSFCDVPREYPREATESFAKFGGYSDQGTCPLTFDKRGVQTFQGRFTRAEPQLLIRYHADCEPHANDFGGTALFRKVGVNSSSSATTVDCCRSPAR